MPLRAPKALSLFLVYSFSKEWFGDGGGNHNTINNSGSSDLNSVLDHNKGGGDREWEEENK